MWTNIIIIAVVLLIVAAIVTYLYKAKKNGESCIGCPSSKQCSGKCGGVCNGKKK